MKNLPIILLVLLCSCNAQKRFATIAAKHPNDAAHACAALFPVHDSVIVHTDTVTTTTQGETQYVTVNCDSAVKYKHDTTGVLVRLACPPAQLITKVVTKDSIVYVENTARIKALEGDATKANDKVDRLKKGRNTWRGIGLISLVVIGIGVVLKIKKFLL